MPDLAAKAILLVVQIQQTLQHSLEPYGLVGLVRNVGGDRWEYFLNDDQSAPDSMSGTWRSVHYVLIDSLAVEEGAARRALESQFYRREGRRAVRDNKSSGQAPDCPYGRSESGWLNWWRGYNEERARRHELFSIDEAFDLLIPQTSA